MKKNWYLMKNINANFIWILMVAIAFTTLPSCSFDPVDKPYSKHTVDEDYARIREISRIDSGDVVLLGKYMVEHNLVGSHVLELHETYKDILIEARKEKEKHDIEKRKKGKNEIDLAKSHENDKMKALKKVLFVDFVKEDDQDTEQEASMLISKKAKKPAVPENKNLLVFHVLFKNIGDKNIQAFKGDINFYDIFHSDIKKITFTSFKEIPVGDSITQKFSINLDEINKSTNTYNNLKKDFIKVEWLPDRLIFTDDTVIE
jgi:hypothetical protein